MQIRTAKIRGWRWIFIIEGIITVLAGLTAWFFLVDFPQKASFLDNYERERVIQRLNKDRGDGEHDQITLFKVLQHLRDPKIWGFSFLVSLLMDLSNLSSLERQLHATPWHISSRTTLMIIC